MKVRLRSLCVHASCLKLQALKYEGVERVRVSELRIVLVGEGKECAIVFP